jgi:hypothetical protein
MKDILKKVSQSILTWIKMKKNKIYEQIIEDWRVVESIS